jgi:short-subunit dehydrogenase
MQHFEGKTAWVTGASSGIGRELCHQLAARGARVVLSARREDALQRVCDELPAIGGEHRVAVLDLSDADQAFLRGQQIIREVGEVDILINAAGISQRALVSEAVLGVYRQLMEVNYFGTVALTKVVLPSMLERGSGSIVAISSVAGKVGSQHRSGYSGAKFAVCGFMDCLRAEVSAAGIHCLTICPGYVKTEIAINALRADGQPQGESTEEIDSGMPVEACCEKILQALERRRDEVVIARGSVRWAPLLKRFCPGMLRRVVAGRKS